MAVAILNRDCSHDYRIPGTDKVIEKGTSVFIPVYGLHHDPKYYPEPEKFIPERFSEENKSDSRPYYPFGDGPRICIGMRLGLMQTKLNIATFLRNYRYELADCMKGKEIKLATTVLTIPAHGIELKIFKR